MSNVQISTRTVIQHRFVVPCPEPWGGVPADLDFALHLAKMKAEGLDIDTRCDDWCGIHVENEAMVLVVTEARQVTP